MASHCAKILSSMYAALNSDPDVIIKLDISNAFNVLCRQLTLDVLGGKASCDYACGLKEGDNIETVCEELRNMFQYFKAMRTTKTHLRYFDYLGNVLDAWGKTGGQQGDPLEMITFCQHPLPLSKFERRPQLAPGWPPPRRVRRGIRRR